MILNLHTILLIAAFVLFLLGALPRVPQRFNYVSAGLALWVLSILLLPA